MRGPLSPSAGRRRTPLGAMRVPGGPSPLSAGRLLPPPSLLKCILIKVDAGLPSSCGNTLFGWMWIPASSSAMTAYVAGLWLSGNAGSVTVAVYTTGLASNGYCQVVQVQPSS